MGKSAKSVVTCQRVDESHASLSRNEMRRDIKLVSTAFWEGSQIIIAADINQLEGTNWSLKIAPSQVDSLEQQKQAILSASISPTMTIYLLSFRLGSGQISFRRRLDNMQALDA